MIESNARMGSEDVHPVVHAGVLAYGFVFLHPFEDGNGCIHRFLIHNVLARRGYTPNGMVFPVSATMPDILVITTLPWKNIQINFAADPVFALDSEGKMVHNETADLYRFMDLTAQVEALSSFIRDDNP
ncbi:MAG: Fic family protein [Fibrobacteres bacterium]|nr:Fic family protein [Fibrobacterota bacterium]